MSERHRLIFAGTPDFAVPSLAALLEGPWDVVAVLTQPDRPAGRGRRPQASPVKRAAEAACVPILQPETLRDAQVLDRLRALAPDAFIVAAYGLLLPQAALDLPPHGCVNVHASLLPRWRGAAPIQRALLAGDARTGISLMRMVRALDAGPVYSRHALDITPADTGGTLHDRLAALGGDALRERLPAILAGGLSPDPQDEAGVTYAPKLDKAEARIDWRDPAAAIARQVRAFNPWPVAETSLDDVRIRIWRARALAMAHDAPPGTVLDAPAALRVATGDGVLEIDELQWPGRRPLAAAAFVQGRPLAGTRLT